MRGPVVNLGFGRRPTPACCPGDEMNFDAGIGEFTNCGPVFEVSGPSIEFVKNDALGITLRSIFSA